MPATNIIVREMLGSRTYSYEAGKITATRTFKVWDSTGSLETPQDIRAVFGTAGDQAGFVGGENWLPEINEGFPDTASLYAQSYSISREEGTDIWQVVWTYRNAEVGTGEQPGEPGYVEYTLDVSAGFTDSFFLNPLYPTDGSVSANEGANKITGGVQIDVEGTPISALRLTTDINITEVVESTGGMPSVYGAARSARGKRNNAQWEGLRKGLVVYIGCSVRRIGVSLYSIQHRLQEASDYHLIQYPERDSTGKIPTTPINGRDRAKTVLWRQPFPEFYDFTSISSNW